MSYKNKYIKYKLKYLDLCNVIGGSNQDKKQAIEGKEIVLNKSENLKQDKEDINLCFANVMSEEEEDILDQLINVWSEVSEQLDIKWSVCAGSYVGLKRNGGRIPWDDDFDITIMKKDLSKFKNINEIFSKHNVIFSYHPSIKLYKISFNDHRAKSKFDKYNWPFIDIFASDDNPQCKFLEDSELPLEKVKFGKTDVFVYKKPSKNRGFISDTKWMHEELDNKYRHQKESFGPKHCDPRAISDK